MVFSCGKCGSRYRIDEKQFEGKSLRFACRKCGQLHLLRDPALGGETVTVLEGPATGAHGASHAAARPTQSVPTVPGSGLVARPTQSAPTVPVSGAVPRAAAPGGPARRRTTQTTSLPAVPTRQTVEMARAVAQEASTPSGLIANEISRPAIVHGDDVWFAIRKGQRVGPFSNAALGEQLRDGTLHERSFVWRPTMEAWARMTDVPALGPVLAEHRTYLAAQAQERTLVQPLPKAEPKAPIRVAPEEPPPLPAAPPEAPPPLPPPPGKLVDGLFSGVDRPSIDLRKASEVQPEEPPRDMPPSWRVPPAERRAGADRRHAGDRRHVPATPEPPPPPPASTADLAFEHGLVFPVSDEPPHPAAAPTWGVEPGGMAGDRTAQPVAKKVSRSAQVGIQEFSLLMRIEGRRKRTAVIAIASVGAGLVLAIGLGITFAIVEPGPPPAPEPEPEAVAMPVLAPVRKPVESRTESAPAQPLAADPRPVAKARPADPAALAAAAAKAKMEKVGPVDPAVKEEFERYAALMGAEEKKEAAVEVKPKTLTAMPQQNLTKSSMDAFMSGKMRKFSECKAKMTRTTDMPVKVGLAFSVDPDGKVENIVIDQAGSRDDGLDTCIRRIVAGWAFPPQEEPAQIKTTLLL